MLFTSQYSVGDRLIKQTQGVLLRACQPSSEFHPSLSVGSTTPRTGVAEGPANVDIPILSVMFSTQQLLVTRGQGEILGMAPDSPKRRLAVLLEKALSLIKIECPFSLLAEYLNRVIRLAQIFVIQCLCHNILFVAERVPGINNAIADALSWFQEHRFRELAPEASIQSNLMPVALWKLGRERSSK